MPASVAESVYALLSTLDSDRLVLAESCTGGMAAALLTQVPGISEFFCGSAVTYRESAKHDWLHVDADTLEKFTAESQPTSDEMAIGALQQTTEATLSAAITGHLGPDVETELDGIVFVTIARRVAGKTIQILEAAKFQLQATDRIARQKEAAELMLERVVLILGTREK